MQAKINLHLIVFEMVIVFVQAANVELTLQNSCYETNDDIKVTATLLAAPNVQSVEWYYSGNVSGNKNIDSACAPVGSPTGYPPSMKFECPSAKSYTITVPVKDVTLPVIFGAMFTDSGAKIYHMLAVQATECSSTEKWKIIAIIFIVLFCVSLIGGIAYCCVVKFFGK